VTGVFLHRNGPRQEIDIEILGSRPCEMLVNVFYNPGDPGTRLETGFYGTPTRIPLGYDATKGFHRYEIEWTEGRIRWWVDDRLVHERAEWVPTPVPDLPLEFNINLWSSESVRFAGELDPRVLPVETAVEAILFEPSAETRTHHSAP
jgi:beta-glucanase (GH16 family)